MANVRNGVQASETRAKISSTDSKMVHEGELSVERCVPLQSVTSPTLAVPACVIFRSVQVSETMTSGNRLGDALIPVLAASHRLIVGVGPPVVLRSSSARSRSIKETEPCEPRRAAIQALQQAVERFAADGLAWER